MSEHEAFMRLAIEAAVAGVNADQGGPFGAIVVKDGVVIGRGCNQVTSSCDPTAHAEIQAIREACASLREFQLEDCDLYASCEPCPMCLGAIYWARPRAVYFAATRQDAAKAGFDDALIYDEIPKPPAARRLPMQSIRIAESDAPFRAWAQKEDRVRY